MRIIKRKAERHITCAECLCILAYTKEDIKDVVFAYPGFDAITISAIHCPECGDIITVEPWGE